MKIRPAVPQDAAEIERLFQQFVAYLRSVGDTSDYRFGAARFLEDGFGADPAFQGIVAEEETGLIGYVLFCKGYDGDYVRRLYIIDLFVQDRSRGNGVGRRLMDAARAEALKAGIRRLSWSVHKKNQSAIRFYRHLGASRVEDTDVMYLEF